MAVYVIASLRSKMRTKIDQLYGDLRARHIMPDSQD